jgi:hypothetical protein
MSIEQAFESWARRKQPWLVEAPEDDFERLLQVTAREAFSAGESTLANSLGQRPKLANNAALRALFTLPPMSESASTALAVPEMPQPSVTTGDREVDAVLWLQKVVSTGHQAYIDKAMEAVKLIKTPMKTLEDRYAAYLKASGAHMFQILFGTTGFGELKKQADDVLAKARKSHEALSRFGSVDALFADTPAEKACKKALRGLKRGVAGLYDDHQALPRFNRHPHLVPATIDDCLHARAYWRDLYRLRYAVSGFGDSAPAAFAHECYCRLMLAHVVPCSRQQAIAALDHIYDDDAMEGKDGIEILRNLVASGWENVDREQVVSL